jgi:hypothetical protein
VRLWNADTGEPIARLTGHKASVDSVVFSPDGHQLASASADSTVRVWNADTGQPIGAPLTGHTHQVFDVVFSPDGQRLASASQDDTVRRWPAVASPDMLCAKLTANISHQEWRAMVSPDIDYITVCPDLLEAAHGNPLAALDYLTRAIRNYDDSGTTTQMHTTLAVLAVFLHRLGRSESAATISGSARGPFTTAVIPELDAAITNLRGVLGDQTFESLARMGEATTTPAIVTYAYDQIDQARAELNTVPK